MSTPVSRESARVVPLAAQASGSSFDDLADQVWSMMQKMTDPQFFCSRAPSAWQPRINIYETETCYLVCVELAGMACHEIDVRVSGSTLCVQGSRPKPPLPIDAPEVSVHAMEIDSGRFARELPLPGDVAAERIAANYRQGYLWVVLPRDNADSAAPEAP